MEFACYTKWEELPGSANSLFAEVEKDSVFFSRPWLEDLVSGALEQGQSLVLACVLERDRVLAILPLTKGDSETHLRSLAHLYTSLYTLLLTDRGRKDILNCLVLGLSRLPVDSLHLDPVAEYDSNLQGLRQALESSGYTCYRHFRFYNWIHRPNGRSFDEYMASRPSRVRNTIARKRRKLAREQAYAIRVFTSGDLKEAMTDYHTVCKASWKARELHPDFVEELANSLASQNWLRLGILYIDDAPAAAQFWFVAHGKASIFRLVYDEVWKRYSPGSILTSHLMEHVIDIDRVEEIDFLYGNDAYKGDWMSERRQRWKLCCARPRPTAGRAKRMLDSLRTWHSH